MFIFSAVMAEGVRLLYANMEPVINDVTVVGSEVALIVPNTAGYPTLLRYWQAAGKHQLVCVALNGTRTYTLPLTADIADPHWLDELFVEATNAERATELRAALAAWVAGVWQGVWFQRVSRSEIESNLRDVRGGSYRQATRPTAKSPTDYSEWDVNDLQSRPVIEYWITHVPDEPCQMVAFYSDEPEPISFEGRVDWWLFSFQGPDAPDVTVDGVVETDFDITLDAAGNWTRMRTLYVEYLEIYEHDTGFETAGGMLQLLKAVICASGRDITE